MSTTAATASDTPAPDAEDSNPRWRHAVMAVTLVGGILSTGLWLVAWASQRSDYRKYMDSYPKGDLSVFAHPWYQSDALLWVMSLSSVALAVVSLSVALSGRVQRLYVICVGLSC